MAATKVYSTAAYWCAAAFALILSLCPKFGAIINTIPAGVLGGRDHPAVRHDRHGRHPHLG